MNTAAQPAVTDAQIEAWLRTWYAAQARPVVATLPPPVSPTWRQRWRSRLRARHGHRAATAAMDLGYRVSPARYRAPQ